MYDYTIHSCNQHSNNNFFLLLKKLLEKKSFICIRRNHIFQVELENSLEKISLQMNLFTFFTKKLTILTHLTSQIT
jgi:hypothetical protein